MKARRKAILVSTPTQIYQGRATKPKARTAQSRRRSHSRRNFPLHSKNRTTTANGRTRPTGPLVKTAKPALIPPAMDQPKLPVPDSASVGAEGEVEGPAKPRQNSSSVRSVKALSRASGLAK